MARTPAACSLLTGSRVRYASCTVRAPSVGACCPTKPTPHRCPLIPAHPLHTHTPPHPPYTLHTEQHCTMESTDDSLSLHPSQFSDSGDLLELSHQLDDVAARFKRMVMDAVKQEKAKMSALHAREVAELNEKHEAEKLELTRQRDECRQYWYKNKEMNEELHRSLVHRAERFAITVASRPNTVWKQSPELLRKAFETPSYRMNLKRNVFGAWRKITTAERNRTHLRDYVERSAARRAKKNTFSAWRVFAQSEAAQQKQLRFQAQVKTEWDSVVNDHESEISSLRDQVAKLKKMLETESQHRGALEERLKVAFMRGVCALNLEAMQVMKTDEPSVPRDPTPSTHPMTAMSATPIQPLSEDSPDVTHYDPLLSLSSVPQPPLNRAPVVEAIAPGTHSAIRVSSVGSPSQGMRSETSRKSSAASGGSASKPSSAGPSPKARPPLAGHAVGNSSTLTRKMQQSISAKEIHTTRRF